MCFPVEKEKHQKIVYSSKKNFEFESSPSLNLTLKLSCIDGLFI